MRKSILRKDFFLEFSAKQDEMIELKKKQNEIFLKIYTLLGKRNMIIKKKKNTLQEMIFTEFNIMIRRLKMGKGINAYENFSFHQ